MKPPLAPGKHVQADSLGSGAKAYYGGKSSFMKRKMNKVRRRADKKEIT